MKKFFTTLFALTLSTGLAFAIWHYSGPWDERMPPDQHYYDITLGWLAQYNDFSGMADVIEDEAVAPDFPHGYFKLRIVNAIYGCTNGQELVIRKDDLQNLGGDFPAVYDPLFEYYPTNHSRIVFAALTKFYESDPHFSAKDWKSPPQPETIMTPTNPPGMFWGDTRSWWYDGYQDNLPYTHFTNLVHVTRIERNWTNFYHFCRDAVPSPSARIWKDSFHDLEELFFKATREQWDFMMNDPLLNNEVKLNMEGYLERSTMRPFPTDD